MSYAVMESTAVKIFKDMSEGRIFVRSGILNAAPEKGVVTHMQS